MDGEGVAAAIDAPPATARQTPRAFMHALQRRSQSDLRRIVLPEGTEPRVLRAAADVVRRGLAFITLLGNHGAIQVPQQGEYLLIPPAPPPPQSHTFPECTLPCMLVRGQREERGRIASSFWSPGRCTY